MKLTIADREAFVRAAMDDVPQIDYDEQAKKLVLDHLKEVLPIDLQNAIAKYPEWFEAKTIQMPGCLQNFATRLCNAGYTDRYLNQWPELKVHLEELAKAKKAQDTKREALSSQLKGAILSCNTLKQAKEVLPEFVKYLPEDRDGDKKCRQMPVIANLVADLMQAGWPKDKANAQAAAG